MTIGVSDRRLLAPLMDALAHAGCAVARVDDVRCSVVPGGDDAEQDYLELSFFARAWAGRRGIQVQIDA